MVTIYCLVDPRDWQVRYVGKTQQKLSYRLSGHLLDKCKCHRVHWINELRSLGLRPIIVPFLPLGVEDDWSKSECFWISFFKADGFNLTNNTIGGDGTKCLPPEARAKIRIAWFGRKHKPETIEKFRLMRKGQKHTVESRIFMSLKMKGRKITWGKKLRDAVRKLDRAEANVIKARLDDGERVIDIANELGLHRTTVSKIKTGKYFKLYRSYSTSNHIKPSRVASLIQ